MDLQLYNTLPEWAFKLNAGSYMPPVVIEKKVLRTNGGNKIDTDKRGTSRDFNFLLGVDNPLVQSELNALSFTLQK